MEKYENKGVVLLKSEKFNVKVFVSCNSSELSQTYNSTYTNDMGSESRKSVEMRYTKKKRKYRIKN